MTEISIKVSDDNLYPGLRKNDVLTIDINCVLKPPARLVQIYDKTVIVLSDSKTIQGKLIATYRAL